MTQRGVQLASSIRNEIICPDCSYSLRGLPGDLIRCPECGVSVNLSSLVAAQWRGPWYRAPLYNTLALPLAWGFLISLFSLFGLGVAYRHDCPPAWLVAAILALIWGGWALLLVAAVRKFGSREALWLALLLHAVLPAYTFGIIGSVAMLIKLFYDLQQPWLIIYDVIVLVALIAAVLGARLTERFIGRRCIRRFLRAQAAIGTINA